jgi:hypothetical protein
MDVLAAYREVGSYRGAAELCGTTHKTVKRIVERHNRGGAATERKDRGHNYERECALVTDRVGKTNGKISAERPKFIDHDPPVPGSPDGPEGVRKAAEVIRQAFPDWRSDVQHMIAEGAISSPHS